VRSNLTAATNTELLDVPLETFLISLTPSFAPEAAAAFFSAIAYPFPHEKEDRIRFHYALCRWAIHTRSKADREWAAIPQMLKPRAFLYLNTEWPQIVDQGVKKLNERFVVAQLIVLPYYIALQTGEKPKSMIPGYEPNSRDMSIFCLNISRARKGEDVDADPIDADPGNFSRRQWKPTRVIAHGLLAFLAFHHKLAQRRNEQKQPQRRKVERQLAPTVLHCFHSPESIREIILHSEAIRKRLVSIKKLRIKEDQTIAFAILPG
jgi:hypothetical protein